MRQSALRRQVAGGSFLNNGGQTIKPSPEPPRMPSPTEKEEGAVDDKRRSALSRKPMAGDSADCPDLLGLDYYAVLGLQRGCNDVEIRRAFKRLALRFHPERSEREGDENRQDAFAVVAEAYECLSDPYKRAVYDQCGEGGLKKGVPQEDGCVKPYVFHGEPLRTYREFYGTESPYADLLDNLANPVPLEDCPETHGVKKKDEAVIKPLPLTLNEVFHGGIKKMKIQRLVLVGGNNKATTTTALEEKILSIPIMPGMPSGTKIVFPEEGDQGPTKIPADVVFVTEDKPHETFKREGSNLRMTVNVFLSEALTGTIVTVRTVDDRILRVPITSVISPEYEKVIHGEGLPKVEDPERRGDLIIDFKIEFPSYMSAASKDHVLRAFDTVYDEPEDCGDCERTRRMVFDGKIYMRADKLSQICRP